jgi:hypothetical protein
VPDDELGILARDLRHERDEAVPEREGVAGVQARVGELADALEREVVELEELANASQVEQPVASDRPRDPPEEDAESAPRERGPPAPGRGGKCRRAPEHGCRERGRARHEEEHAGQRERGLERERYCERGEEEGEGPRERGGNAPDSERAGEEPPGSEDERQRDPQPDVEGDRGHPSSRSAVLPEASQAAVSR